MRRPSFTLVEVLVVLSILAILLGLVTISVRGVWSKSQISRIEADLTVLAAATKLYVHHTSTTDLPTQEQLVTEGYLRKSLDAPIENGSYRIERRGTEFVVALHVEGVVYERGDYIAQKTL